MKAPIIIGSILIVLAFFSGLSIGKVTPDPKVHMLPIKDSICYDLYRAVDLNGNVEPLLIDTNMNIVKATDTVSVNSTNHILVNIEHDDLSNTHRVMVGVFIKRVKFLDEGEDNQ